jgi:hypothetical protein
VFGKCNGAAISDQPAIAFDVDHQRVELRRVNEFERRLRSVIANAEHR